MEYKTLRMITIALAVLAILTVVYFWMTDFDLIFLAIIPVVLATIVQRIADKKKEKR